MDHVITAGQSDPMPTDYFSLAVRLSSEGQPDLTCNQAVAFLLEDQWVIKLPPSVEDTPGAAPDQLVVYGCNMFLPQKTLKDGTTRLSRQSFPDIVQDEIIPNLVQAYLMQTNTWGFSWNEAWVSYRDEGDPEQLSVALSDGKTWYHGKIPIYGHGGISITLAKWYESNYDSILDGISSTFHHELFHNLQRSINQSLGGGGDIDGKNDAWSAITEGMASFVTSVGQTSLELRFDIEKRGFLSMVNQYIGRGNSGGDLNNSYRAFSPYHTALYWRFLYEQCGSRQETGDDPISGMQIIRRVLSVLYSRTVVDIRRSEAFVEKFPAVMDLALDGSACPFQDYRSSLVHFSRAIYSLRVRDGRCQGPCANLDPRLYDPNDQYVVPLISNLNLDDYANFSTSNPVVFKNAIASSYGMDFIEISVSPEWVGRSLEISVENPANVNFAIQVWKLQDTGYSRLNPKGNPQTISPSSQGTFIIPINREENLEWNVLAIIITRLDSREKNLPGNYQISLQ